jgi:haloacetate dehalogenase
MAFFTGFDEWDLQLPTGVTLHGRSGGDGPAVALLHGHPRAHTTWYRVAPKLAQAGHTVVCPDMRGYGRSSKPAPDANHGVYCAAAKAADTIELMKLLGHERFAVVGHDRGMGVAYSSALDYPDNVSALAVLDGVPRLEADERVNTRFATGWWHWFFFTGSPHAERVITADPDAWYELDDAKRAAMGPENFDYVAAAIRRPDTIRAMLEDYRAGLSVDLDHDRAARAEGRQIMCPTLVGWSIHDDMEQLYSDPAALWEAWVARPITTARIDSGHHMAEENPDQLSTELAEFLARTL